MSRNLYWEPTRRKVKPLPDALKFAMRRRYCLIDGVDLDESAIPYLEGLADAQVEGATILIEAIGRLGSITVKES